MLQSNNQISLYKKIDDKLIKDSNIRFSALSLSYYSTDTLNEENINIESNELNYIQINEYDSMWSPNENNLILKQSLLIEKPYLLFGDGGVTCKNNLIGLAVHIHSKSSSFQKTVSVGTIKNQRDKLELEFEYEFEPSSIRGIVYLDFFLYLNQLNESQTYMANVEGMLLSNENINSIELVIDGEGSSFPITEFDDRKGPLWKLEKNWYSAEEDTFDASNVSLSLNISHPIFKEIRKETRRINQSYMNNIMTQAIAIIIQQVVIVEDYDLDDVEESLIPGTILSAVSYWVKTFDVDTSDLFTIQNSLMNSMNFKLNEVE